MVIQPLGNEAAKARSPLMDGSVEAATALLNKPTEAVGLRAQLETYSALASRWPQASESERPALAQALGESRFAQRIQSTLTVYTRAAWAGSGAAPPEPQKQALAAFDALSPPERQIVAAMRGGPLGALPLTSVGDYRERLRSDLESAQGAASPQRRPDEITLSEAAQARLSGEAASPPGPPPPQPRSPQIAAALEAYAKGLG
jgi:hypothetical protein